MNKPTPKIYRTTNWSSYNSALINRGNLSIWFDPKTQWYAQPKGKHGRNQTYSDTAIQCCLMIKSLFRLSLRMVTGFVQSLIHLCRLDWTAPDYSTICRRQKHIDIQISYEKSCNRLHLLMLEMPFLMDAFLTQRLSKLVLIPCSNATLAIEV